MCTINNTLMNMKPFLHNFIILCLTAALVFSVAVIPVFASDGSFNDPIFFDTINNYPSGSYTISFTDDLSIFSDIISHFNLNSLKCFCVKRSDNYQSVVQIPDGYYPFVYSDGNYTYLYLKNENGNDPTGCTWYRKNSSNSYASQGSPYMIIINGDLTFYLPFSPFKLYIANSSYNNNNLWYTFDDPTPLPSGDFQYISMTKPASAYTALAQTFYSAAAARLHNEFPNEYASIPADQILVDDYNLAALFEAITANTGIFESYAVHSYDFYDNVSYNLAEGMNAIQDAMSNMQDIADNIELLTSVYASEQEIEAREFAADNQQAIVDGFIDPDGDASASVNDYGTIKNASSDFKDAFNTGTSADGIWSVFDNSRYNWFTQNTKNQLDTTPQTRANNDYPTPLLDSYMHDLLSIIGVNND